MGFRVAGNSLTGISESRHIPGSSVYMPLAVRPSGVTPLIMSKFEAFKSFGGGQRIYALAADFFVLAAMKLVSRCIWTFFVMSPAAVTGEKKGVESPHILL